MKQSRLLGPFTELVTMEHLPAGGHISDEKLVIIKDAGVVVCDEMITHLGDFNTLRSLATSIEEVASPSVAIPGLIDAHTHLCYAGTRENDYALRLSGYSYQEIAKRGGGILDTVNKTRHSSLEDLLSSLVERANRQVRLGVTTCEVKSGYGLTIESEVKMLKAIQMAKEQVSISLIPTCLAAHAKPAEFNTNSEYLEFLTTHLFPILKANKLSDRIDIFIEEHAFSIQEGERYLKRAQAEGFKIILHADQFSRGGALLAARLGALSADHLEQSNADDFSAMRKAGVFPIMLPGATLGLGLPFPPAREALDHQLPLVIASDWNPGSAPMGDLLTQASLLGIQQKLSIAETLAALTTRAARALDVYDRGELTIGKRGDIAVFPCGNYKEILYNQGAMKPLTVFKGGKKTFF